MHTHLPEPLYVAVLIVGIPLGLWLLAKAAMYAFLLLIWAAKLVRRVMGWHDPVSGHGD